MVLTRPYTVNGTPSYGSNVPYSTGKGDFVFGSTTIPVN
jgi:hypothetical protein